MNSIELERFKNRRVHLDDLLIRYGTSVEHFESAHERRDNSGWFDRTLEELLLGQPDPAECLDRAFNWSEAEDEDGISWNEIHSEFEYEEFRWPKSKMELVLEDLNGE